MSSANPPRTVVFTGVAPGLSLPISTATAFIKAGLKNIALLGPVIEYLEVVEQHLLRYGLDVNIVVQQVQLISTESLGLASHNVRSQLGAWDVFVHCSSPVIQSHSSDSNQPSEHCLDTQQPARTPIRGADEDLWWEPFERNVRSLHHIARHFFPKMKANATFINIVTTTNNNDCDDRNSAERASQLAAIKVVEYLGRENQSSGLRVMNVQSLPAKLDKITGRMTSSERTGDFFVWCTSDRAAIFNRKFVPAEYTVDELLQAEEQLSRTEALTAGIVK